MEKLLVTCKYPGQLGNAPALDYTDGVLIKEVISLLESGKLSILRWEEIHGDEIDNHCDDIECVTENHTLVEMRMDFPADNHIPNGSATDGGGEEVLKIILDSLETGDPEITYFYSCGDAPLLRSVIGFEINPPFEL